MARINLRSALLMGFLLAATLHAQAPPAGAPPGSQPEPKLAFDREVFSYPAEGRRDPFRPLLGGPDAGGPLFADLRLRGIIYSPDERRSVALVQVGRSRTYRLRRGDVIGNARVLEIQPLRVRFGVENFGSVRNEVLDLRGNSQIQGEAIRDVDEEDAARRQQTPAPTNRDTTAQRPVRVEDVNDDGRTLEPGARP